MGGEIQVWRVEGDRIRALSEERGAWWPRFDGDSGHAIKTPKGAAWLEPVPGAAGTWLQLGPDATPEEARPAHAKPAAALLSGILANDRENGLVAAELATRYEEIDLLYTISDILGRTVKLDEAAKTIVREVSSVVGARRASIMVHDEREGLLRVVAGRGLDPTQLAPVSVDDDCSIAAQVFRESRALTYDAAGGVPHEACQPGRNYRGYSFLCVPILYAPPDGGPRPVGVINLTDRLGEDVFTAGHKKLVMAIANQIGAAIENARLVEVERERARLSTELTLARELQLALMPSQSLLSKSGDIGARSQPAEFVGGDFYDLISLRRDVVGVMMGDVSGHGLAAAMLMAHAISAAGILAQSSASPEEAIERLLDDIGDELRRTEMSMALFYGVVDRRKNVLRYANAGHPHAFVVSANGSDLQRLGATAPPLGLAGEKVVLGAQVEWRPKRDLLCLFTDGMVDSRNAQGEPYGEERLLAVVRANVARPAPQIVDAVFSDLEAFSGDQHQDDRSLLVLRR